MRTSSDLRGAVAALVILAGCGSEASDGLPREPISGRVSFEGKPIERGTIQFVPEVPGVGFQVGSVIQDGRYSIPKESGPVPGKYKASISASAGETKPPESPGADFVLPKELIPPKYNSKSTLTVEVKTGASNRFDFDLSK
jgi:hypothetical protein